jgi:ACR3 family arsenite transporter
MLIFYFVFIHTRYLTSGKLGYNSPDSDAIGFTVSDRDLKASNAIVLAAFEAYPYVSITTATGPLLEIPLMLLLVRLQLGGEQRMNVSKRICSIEVSE